jgi:uncharacterized protein involved in exopolysaccharide biosynthesis
VASRRDLVNVLTTKLETYRIRANEPPATIAVLNWTEVPTAPSGPQIKRTFIIGMGGPVVLAIGLTLVRDHWDHKRKHQWVDHRLREFWTLMRVWTRRPRSVASTSG